MLWGRFCVEDEIGRGGTGIVYRCTDTSLRDTTVAVKVLKPELARDAASRLRLKDEILTARRFDPRHHVRPYSYHEDRLVAGFDMEYLAGATLEDHLAGRVSSSPLAGRGTLERLPHVASIADQLAEALDEIHRAGMVHADLTPSGILLVRPVGTWQIKLLAFVARRKHGSVGAIPPIHPGKAAYLAPEMLSGNSPPTRASDMFALGKIVYRALTGVHPEFLSEVQAPSSLVEGLPTKIDRRLLNCLGRPQLRPTGARPLAKALRSVAFEVNRQRARGFRAADAASAREKAAATPVAKKKTAASVAKKKVVAPVAKKKAAAPVAEKKVAPPLAKKKAAAAVAKGKLATPAAKKTAGIPPRARIASEMAEPEVESSPLPGARPCGAEPIKTVGDDDLEPRGRRFRFRQSGDDPIAGPDIDTFFEMANRHEPCTLDVDSGGTLTRHSVDSLGLYRRAFVRLADDEPDAMRELMEGKSMLGRFERGAFDRRWIESTSQGIESLVGPLQEAIYALIAAQRELADAGAARRRRKPSK